MADSLYPMSVGIEHESREIVSMVLGTQARLTIALATANKCGRVECLNGHTIGSSEAYVHARGCPQIVAFDRDPELNAKETGHRALVGAALLEVDDANQGE
jgi:hypothetical protein